MTFLLVRGTEPPPIRPGPVLLALSLHQDGGGGGGGGLTHQSGADRHGDNKKEKDASGSDQPKPQDSLSALYPHTVPTIPTFPHPSLLPQ